MSADCISLIHGQQSIPSPFMTTEIDERSSVASNRTKTNIQLLATVAVVRPKYVTGQAFTVSAYEFLFAAE
jgi:hypothetical protein